MSSTRAREAEPPASRRRLARHRILTLLVLIAAGSSSLGAQSGSAGAPVPGPNPEPQGLSAASPQGSEPLPFTLAARSAILIDQSTGRVLFERNADMPLAPASLTKLMTLHLVYQKLQDRTISMDDVVTISKNAWFLNQVPGSSLMNLEPGQIVTVEELVKGMMIASGNDAATALAEYVAGTRERFVGMMNEECRWFGYAATRFTDPAGVLPTNVVTAREFADFCRRYVDLHPQSLAEILSVKEFEYPQPWNLPDTWSEDRKASLSPVKQLNPNLMGWNIDGLKTGHLDEENFTAAITMKRGDTRLIVVVLGVQSDNLQEGYRLRSLDCVRLLSYGLRTYSTITPDISPIAPVRVWKGEQESVPLSISGMPRVTVRDSEASGITYTILAPEGVTAPVRKGQKLGTLVFYSGTEQIARYDLTAEQDVGPAGFLKRVWDTMEMGVRSLFGWIG